MELNSSNTNLAANTTFTLPASSGITKFTNNTTNYTTAAINTDSKETVTTGYGAGRNLIGNYYNYCSASAGTICTNAEATDDIFNVCPANWTMPSGGLDGQYGQLAIALDPTNINTTLTGDLATIYRYHLSTSFSGNFCSGQTCESDVSAGSGGVFWSTTRNSVYPLVMHTLGFTASGIYYSNSRVLRYTGLPVRCIFQ